MSTKRIMRAFKMDEISAVTKPAQAHALATIMKRADDADTTMAAIVKALDMAKDDATGAQSFSALLAASEQRQKQYEASEELWPLFCALQDSLRSIAADANLTTQGKLSAIQTSIDEFAATVRDRFPEMEAEIEKLFTRAPFVEIAKAVRVPGGDDVGTKEKPMTDMTKEIAGLKDQVADLTKKLGDKETEIAKMKADEIAKNDETLTVGTETIRKSVVGAAAFTLLKNQQDEIAKAKDVAELATFEKKAEADYGNLPGESVAKAKVLRAIDKLDAADKAELEKMLKAGNAAMKGHFTAAGQDGGKDFAKADDQIDALAKTYAAEHKVPYHKAYGEVLKTEEGRKLYAATTQPQRAA